MRPQTALAFFLLAAALRSSHAQLSKAIADDTNVDSSTNKFLNREAFADQDTKDAPGRVEDEVPYAPCSQDITLRWHTEINTGIYATPLITDLFSDGRKDIIIPGFSHSLAVLEGRTGGADPTFEGEHRSTMHASPLLYDIDFDGVPDIVVPAFDGRIQFFKDNGQSAAYPFTIPRLKVKRDWFKGLHADPIDHSHPDVGADGDDLGLGERGNRRSRGSEATTMAGGRRRLMAVDGKESGEQQNQVDQQPIDSQTGNTAHMQDLSPPPPPPPQQQQQQQQGVQQDTGTQQQRSPSPPTLPPPTQNDNQQQPPQQPPPRPVSPPPASAPTHPPNQQKQTVQAAHEVSAEAAETFSELFGNDQESHGDPSYKQHVRKEWLNEDLAYDEVFEENGDEYSIGNHNVGDRFAGVVDAEDIEEEFDEKSAEEDYQHGAELWEREDEAYDQHHDDDTLLLHGADSAPEVPFVWIDAHILATPAIADIDGDGHDELVIAVSYYFDPGTYAAHSSRIALAVGKDGDPDKYVASGVVVYDLNTRVIKWSQHLDLSTRYTRYKALAESAPTLADVNRDGKLEVILGTSMGFVYVLDPMNGNALEGWPLQMGDIQGQVAVADLDNDGWLEIVAADARGSIAALRPSGKELWERHLGSSIGAGATFADVDGDGSLEVLVGTFDGRVFVLDGSTGQDRPEFPFRTSGRIVAPILATKLDDHRKTFMQLALTSHDGFLYVIDAETACAASMDLGEPGFSMVLADDLAGSGKLDLLVTTATGNVFAFRTAATFHPLKAWPAQSPGPGTAAFTARWNWEGIYATATSRIPRDVRGTAVPVRFTVMDRRPALIGGKKRGPYKVSVTLSGVGAKEMANGDSPVIGMSDLVNTTGTYTIEVPCPKTRTTATIKVEMVDESGALFVDEFALSFHVHFYRLLKWLLVGPLAFTATAILVSGHVLEELLPALPS